MIHARHDIRIYQVGKLFSLLAIDLLAVSLPLQSFAAPGGGVGMPGQGQSQGFHGDPPNGNWQNNNGNTNNQQGFQGNGSSNGSWQSNTNQGNGQNFPPPPPRRQGMQDDTEGATGMRPSPRRHDGQFQNGGYGQAMQQNGQSYSSNGRGNNNYGPPPPPPDDNFSE